jgi:hypothetical protein
MRHVRASTWVLTAVFLVALVAYLLVRPSSTAALVSGPAVPAITSDDHTETELADPVTEWNNTDHDVTPRRRPSHLALRGNDLDALSTGDTSPEMNPLVPARAIPTSY